MIKTMPSSVGGQHRFAEVPKADIPRSQFNRPSNLKTTFDAGYLVPCFLDEVLPGDTFNVRMSGFARLATPIFPLMDNITLDVHFFFIPCRLVWTNWEKFQGAQVNPGDSTAFTVPLVNTTAQVLAVHSIYDYMGLPVGPSINTSFNAMPFRAYNLVYNQWYRDQNLQNSVTVPLGDSADAFNTYTLLRRGKRHDYFTSALTAPQKGTAVTIPIASFAPVVPGNSGGPVSNISPVFKDSSSGVSGASLIAGASGGSVQANLLAGAGTWDTGDVVEWETPNLVADLASSTAATINSLRQAFQIQRIYERDARGGTRYVEALKARWGVTSPDARLQRTEYLGGGSAGIVISPIAQTSATDAGVSPQGNLAAVGTASINAGFAKSFTEHGYILGLMSARADYNYSQGVDRLWTRSTRFDFAEPALTHLGEQTILNKEIYFQGAGADNNVFGYQERHAEYRYKPSQATGLMRPNVAGSLGLVWTLIQHFTALPTLGATFIQENPDVDRVIAVPTEPHFKLDAHFDTKCARALPLFGVPGMIDHF